MKCVLDIFPSGICDKIGVIYFMGEMTLKKDDKTGGDLYDICILQYQYH